MGYEIMSFLQDGSKILEKPTSSILPEVPQTIMKIIFVLHFYIFFCITRYLREMKYQFKIFGKEELNLIHTN